MRRAAFCVVASALLSSCTTFSFDTAKPFQISLTSIAIVDQAVALSEPELRQSQGPRFLVSFSSPVDFESLVSERHLAIRAWVYRCQSIEGGRPAQDVTATSIEAWEVQVYNQSGTILEDLADAEKSSGDYHLYIDNSWWNNALLRGNGGQMPENLCIQVVAVGEDGTASASSAVQLVPKEKLDALSSQFLSSGVNPSINL